MTQLVANVRKCTKRTSSKLEDKYLGHQFGIERNNRTHELQLRLGLSWSAYGQLKNIYKSQLSICSKNKVLFRMYFLYLLMVPKL